MHLKTTEEYRERFPYCDEAMYLRFKEEDGNDHSHQYFVEWFENGCMPLEKVHSKRLIRLIEMMQEKGVDKSVFINTKSGLSQKNRLEIWEGKRKPRERTSQIIYAQLTKKVNPKTGELL